MYSLNLAPSDFLIFQMMKIQLQGRRFKGTVETAPLNAVLDSVMEQKFPDTLPEVRKALGPIPTCNEPLSY
jgi:hypothetical protein